MANGPESFHEHALLIFPAQHLSDDEQVQFAERFGDIELLTANPDKKAVAISNKRPDGKAMDASEFRFRTLRGNEGWHTDSSYMPLAAKASVLSALQVPTQGGETEWADMRDAYDALPDDMREHIGGLSAYHSLYRSQAKIGHVVQTGDGYGYHNQGAPLRPLVKVHPVTGRRALYIGRHAYGIPGLTEDESEALLDELLASACQSSTRLSSACSRSISRPCCLASFGGLIKTMESITAALSLCAQLPLPACSAPKRS